MKIFLREITSCNDCPNVGWCVNGKGLICRVAPEHQDPCLDWKNPCITADDKEILEIPEWCPLPDKLG